MFIFIDKKEYKYIISDKNNNAFYILICFILYNYSTKTLETLKITTKNIFKTLSKIDLKNIYLVIFKYNWGSLDFIIKVQDLFISIENTNIIYISIRNLGLIEIF